jgi:hypothetical protein
MTSCTAPCFPHNVTGGRAPSLCWAASTAKLEKGARPYFAYPSQGDRGRAPSVSDDSGHSALEGLIEMAHGARLPAGGWLPERLRFGLHSEPRVPLALVRTLDQQHHGSRRNDGSPKLAMPSGRVQIDTAGALDRWQVSGPSGTRGNHRSPRRAGHLSSRTSHSASSRPSRPTPCGSASWQRRAP